MRFLVSVWFAAAVIQPALANEQLGRIVRQLADACVGASLETPPVMQSLASAGRTATGVCTCAAEVFVFTEPPPSNSFDVSIKTEAFRMRLIACANARHN